MKLLRIGAVSVGVLAVVIILLAVFSHEERVASGACGLLFERMGGPRPTRTELARAADNCTALFRDPRMKRPLGQQPSGFLDAATLCASLDGVGCLTWDRSTNLFHISHNIVWERK